MSLQEAIAAETWPIDVPMAVLVVATHLETLGGHNDAAMLRMELGEMMIRAALDKSIHPDPVALGARMAAALHLVELASRGVNRGVTKKPTKKGRR